MNGKATAKDRHIGGHPGYKAQVMRRLRGLSQSAQRFDYSDARIARELESTASSFRLGPDPTFLDHSAY